MLTLTSLLLSHRWMNGGDGPSQQLPSPFLLFTSYFTYFKWSGRVEEWNGHWGMNGELAIAK
jgi:hypothetical protein